MFEKAALGAIFGVELAMRVVTIPVNYGIGKRLVGHVWEFAGLRMMGSA